jgi:hypothetical protein
VCIIYIYICVCVWYYYCYAGISRYPSFPDVLVVCVCVLITGTIYYINNAAGVLHRRRIYIYIYTHDIRRRSRCAHAWASGFGLREGGSSRASFPPKRLSAETIRIANYWYRCPAVVKHSSRPSPWDYIHIDKDISNYCHQACSPLFFLNFFPSRYTLTHDIIFKFQDFLCNLRTYPEPIQRPTSYKHEPPIFNVNIC